MNPMNPLRRRPALMSGLIPHNSPAIQKPQPRVPEKERQRSDTSSRSSRSSSHSSGRRRGHHRSRRESHHENRHSSHHNNNRRRNSDRSDSASTSSSRDRRRHHRSKRKSRSHSRHHRSRSYSTSSYSSSESRGNRRSREKGERKDRKYAHHKSLSKNRKHDAATKIQSAYRRRLARKKVKSMRKEDQELRRTCLLVANDLVAEFLVEQQGVKSVAAMALREEVAGIEKDQRNRASKLVVADLIEEHLKAVTSQLASAVIKSIVSEHMDEAHRLQQRNPLLAVVDDLFGEVIVQLAREVAPLAVREEASEYLQRGRIRGVMDELIVQDVVTVLTREAVMSAISESEAGMAADMLMEEVVVEELDYILTRFLPYIQSITLAAARQKDADAISAVSRSVIIRPLMLAQCVRCLAKKGSPVLLRRRTTEVLRRRMAERFIGLLQVEETSGEALVKSSPLLAVVYEKVVIKAGSEALLDILLAGIDRDEENLHQAELRQLKAEMENTKR